MLCLCRGKTGLLILDEFGYLPPEAEAGPLLYDLLSSHYERGATIITTNKSLPEWGKVLHDSALASALLDREFPVGALVLGSAPWYGPEPGGSQDGQ